MASRLEWEWEQRAFYKDEEYDDIHRFVFDLENWVYSNIGYINLLVSSGKFSNNLDLGAINKLTINLKNISYNIFLV